MGTKMWYVAMHCDWGLGRLGKMTVKDERKSAK